MKFNSYKTGLLLLLIIIAMYILVPANAYLVEEDQEGLSTEIYLPAVDENGKGTIILVNVTIMPHGSGSVEVLSNGKVDPTTKYSMIQAAVTGTLLAGFDWRSFDYRIYFVNATDVAGPSGSAMVSYTIYSLLTNSPVVNTFSNITMTGAITPVGLYSAVGGIEAKCLAAEAMNLTFYYPLANLDPKIVEDCPNAQPTTGFINTTLLLTNTSLLLPQANITLPYGFEDGMRQASSYLSEATKSVLEKIPVESLGEDLLVLYNSSMNALNESSLYYSSHPYASASRAFYALTKALQLYYLYEIMQLGTSQGVNNYILNVSNQLETNLTRLSRTLDQLDPNGSIYYVEFVGIAYSRLASAEASLSRIPVLLPHNMEDAIAELAYVHARIYSINSWIQTALLVRDLEPRITSYDVHLLATLMGDFAHISAQYSISLAQYMIENYEGIVDTSMLKQYVETLNELVDQGDRYAMQANYIAALGFYREVLSQSMSNLFTIITPANNSIGITIYKGYLNETIMLYNVLSLKIIGAGLIPGLAPAYLDYALLEAEKGDYESALILAQHALASALVWYLYIASFNPLATTTEQPPEIFAPGTPSNIPYTLMMLSILLAGILVGLVYSMRYLRKTLEMLVKT